MNNNLSTRFAIKIIPDVVEAIEKKEAEDRAMREAAIEMNRKVYRHSVDEMNRLEKELDLAAEKRDKADGLVRFLADLMDKKVEKAKNIIASGEAWANASGDTLKSLSDEIRKSFLDQTEDGIELAGYVHFDLKKFEADYSKALKDFDDLDDALDKKIDEVKIKKDKCKIAIKEVKAIMKDMGATL